MSTLPQFKAAPSLTLPVNRYELLGLKRNAFSVQALEGFKDYLRSIEPQVPTPGDKLFYQLMGSSGAGKTTLIEQFREVEPGPYVRTGLSLEKYKWLPLGKIVYWDELCRASVLNSSLSLMLQRFSSATIVAGVHKDLSDFVKCFGYRVETYRFPDITADEILEFSRKALVRSSITGEPTISLSRYRAEQIALKAKDSWWQICDCLHRWLQEALDARVESAVKH